MGDHFISHVMINNMKETEIGKVTIAYDENGVITNANFVPTMDVVMDDNLIHQLKNIQHSKDSAIIRQNSDVVFGAWFNRLTQIEMHDCEKYHVVSEPEKCVKYDNGNVKSCTIRYIFREIKN